MRMYRTGAENPHCYDDMIDLPHPEPRRHPRMSAAARAAQFAPFAALAGYGEAIEETARLVDRWIELSESEQAELSRKLSIAQSRLQERPVVSITHFVPDPFKEGGRYEIATGPLKRISVPERLLVLEDGQTFGFIDVIDIDGEIFEGAGD